jgi:hypothetical protein
MRSGIEDEKLNDPRLYELGVIFPSSLLFEQMFLTPEPNQI